MNGSSSEQGLLPYSVISAATSGDSEAIRATIRHYSRYIAYLSMSKSRDKNGDFRWEVNNELFERLKSKLIYAVLEFQI